MNRFNSYLENERYYYDKKNRSTHEMLNSVSKFFTKKPGADVIIASILCMFAALLT